MNTNKLTNVMVDLLNYKIKEKGSNLKYVVDSEDEETISYKLIIEDKFINNEYAPRPNITDEFEKYVRDFFKEYGVEKTGFSNTVSTLFALNKSKIKE